jgi:DNA-binding response OmpR family regulator
LTASGDRRGVVAVVPQDHDSQPTSAPMRTGRATWLILAVDGPATEVADRVPSTAVRVIADPRRFRDVLLAERPRIVLCAQPPADADALRLVAEERRRRSAMRAIHLAPPEAVAERLAALAAGFDDALATTTDAEELAGRLTWLETKARARPGSPIVLPIGDGFDLDLAAHELRRNGEVVHLRPKEFGLLALLAAHPGRAYTRRELLHLVWGPSHAGGPRTVDVHIRWLRSKIEREPDRPTCLLTVRGVGYRLDDRQR